MEPGQEPPGTNAEAPVSMSCTSVLYMCVCVCITTGTFTGHWLPCVCGVCRARGGPTTSGGQSSLEKCRDTSQRKRKLQHVSCTHLT